MMTRREVTAYHEIGHALAMYLCYGNIDRIESLIVLDESGATLHAKEGRLLSIPVYPDRGGLSVLFNEVCYSLGGVVAERLFTDNTEEDIEAGALCDMEKMNKYMLGYGLAAKKDRKALEQLATSYLSRAFLEHGLKVRELASILVEEGDIGRLEFYRVFDKKLFRKERRKLYQELKKNVE